MNTLIAQNAQDGRQSTPAQRLEKEVSEAAGRYRSTILSPASDHEEKMWARVYCRRMSIPWPETVDLKDQTLDNDDIARLKHSLSIALTDVAAFLEERGLDN